MKILPGIRPVGWWEDFWKDPACDYGRPSKTLLKYSSQFYKDLITNKKPTVVDIGSGNGRYAIPLAELGYTVDAIELTASGVERILAEAKQKHLYIGAVQGDFIKLCSEQKSYDLVLSSGLIEEVEPKHHKNIIEGFKNWVGKSGYALVKYCLEIQGRGQLVQEGLVPELFNVPGWEILYVEEEKEMHPSRAQFVKENEIDSAIRTGTLVAHKI
ncbi:MAG: class I SAM-dependent methyltransferase [bacterium]|nr:class I SAM-dependent methyltransferase [bacterium]